MIAMFYALIQQGMAQIAAMREILDAEHAVLVSRRVTQREACAKNGAAA